MLGLMPVTGTMIDFLESPPSVWDPEHVRTVLMGLSEPWMEENRRFFNGDHWQDGSQWIGPMPPQDDQQTFTTLSQEIYKRFISKNCISEVVERAVSGVLGHEPSWSFTVSRPTDAGRPISAREQKLIDEAEALITDWWDSRDVLETLTESVTRSLYMKRGMGRFHVPPQYTGAATPSTLVDGTLQQWARRIAYHAPENERAAVVTDPTTLEEVGLYFTSGKDGSATVEVVWVEGEDENAVTHIRVIDTEDLPKDYTVESIRTTIAQSPAANLKLRGNLTIGQVKTPLLITPQVKALQKAINQALTMAEHNVVLAGFLERVVTNGMPPGHYEDRLINGQTKKVFVKEEYQMGPGTVNYIMGVPIHDTATGEVIGMTNPNMSYRDPVSADVFDKTARMFYRALLEEVRQVHALVSGDQYPSGEARRQARADFETFLRRLKNAINKFGRWLIETALHFIASLAGQPDYFNELRAVFECRVDPGPATAESIRAAIELNDADMLSNESGMIWGGVEDPKLERNRIETERAAGIIPKGQRRPEPIPMGQNDQRREGAGPNA
jgi:hypothetical protein